MKKTALKLLFLVVLLLLLVFGVAYAETEQAKNSVLDEPELKGVNEPFKTEENRLSSAVKLIKNMKYDEALPLLELMAEEQQDNAEVYYLIGCCHSGMQRYKKAIKAYKKAIRIKPDYPAALNNLGASYSALKRYSKAVKAYKQAILYDPGEEVYHASLAEDYIELGRYEEAIESFKKAVSLKPEMTRWHLDLGLVYLCIGDKSSALKQCEVLKELDPYLANELLKVIKGESDTIRLFPHPQKKPEPLPTTKVE